MHRRHVLTLAAAFAIPYAAHAQRRTLRIGFLGGISPDPDTQKVALVPFREALRELGHVEGQNLTIDFRWAEGDPARLPGLAAELLKLDVDVLVTMGPRPAMVAKAATTTVPILAAAVDNPVQMGLIADFSRPGANITGISGYGGELVAKRLQLLKELVPSTRRVAVLMNPATLARQGLQESLAALAPRVGLAVQIVEAAAPEQFEAAFEAMARERAEGVLVLADATFWIHRARLHELVAKRRLPSVWGGRGYLEGGGLASYQSDFPTMFRRAAAMVDALLKGARPATMPFEQATKLELVINLRSARALGITVPPALLVAADELIE
jgi:putative ABC transport system substrate-binding protein